jgi:TRAP-type uncharacterized transport system substrate-binding protein
VRLTPTPGSVFQLTGLIEGKFDIAETAIDNVIAYMEGQGEASVSVKPDLFVFMGGDSGLLSLTVLPEIKTYADLKGKTLSVDAMTTGYAFVLFDLLKRNGLSSGDYNLVRAGGVLERWEGLRNRRHDGTSSRPSISWPRRTDSTFFNTGSTSMAIIKEYPARRGGPGPWKIPGSS